MSDLISMKAILKHIEKVRQSVQMVDDIRRASIIMNGMNLCEEAVRNQPSAQPERKKGRLINPTPYGECSECGYLIDSREGYNFCPNCGSDMRGDIDG